MLLTLFGYSQETLSLSQAIKRGLKNNFSVLSIKKDEKVAEINNTWGNAGAYPSLDFSASYRESSDDNNIEDFDQSSLNAGVEINWVLFNGFSIKIAKHKLNEFDNLSKGNTALVIENAIQSIVLAYYSALLEKEKMGVSLQLMRLSEDRYEKMKMQKELGNSVTYDVLQAQNAYLEDKSNYLLQKANYNNTIRELNFLMGEKSENKYTLITDFAPEVVLYDLKILLDKMLSENNTLKNKYISIKINELDIALAKSAYLPKLSIGSGVAYRDSESDYYVRGKQLSKGNNAYASLNLTYKIYNGGSKKRAVEIARIEKEIAEIDKEEIKRQLENQMARLLEIYDVRKQLFLLAEENMKAAELNLKISEEKFKTGSINSFNYRDVQIIYQNAAIGRLNAIFNLIDANTSLVKLTGGLLKETSNIK